MVPRCRARLRISTYSREFGRKPFSRTFLPNPGHSKAERHTGGPHSRRSRRGRTVRAMCGHKYGHACRRWCRLTCVAHQSNPEHAETVSACSDGLPEVEPESDERELRDRIAWQSGVSLAAPRGRSWRPRRAAPTRVDERDTRCRPRRSPRCRRLWVGVRQSRFASSSRPGGQPLLLRVSVHESQVPRLWVAGALAV